MGSDNLTLHVSYGSLLVQNEVELIWLLDAREAHWSGISRGVRSLCLGCMQYQLSCGLGGANEGLSTSRTGWDSPSAESVLPCVALGSSISQAGMRVADAGIRFDSSRTACMRNAMNMNAIPSTQKRYMRSWYPKFIVRPHAPVMGAMHE